MFQLTQQGTVAKATKFIALSAVLLFALTACSIGGTPAGSETGSNSGSSSDSAKGSDDSSTGETRVSYTKAEGGVQTTLTYYAKGDEVTKQTTESIINYAEAGLGDRAQAEATFAPIVETFQGVKGLEHSIEYSDTAAHETLTVDYAKADLAEVAALTGSTFEGDASSGSKVSLAQSIAFLKSNGFTEVQ